MAGTPEKPEDGIPETVGLVMVSFEVDEKTARQLLAFSSVLASETVTRWKSSVRASQTKKAKELLELIGRVQHGDSAALVAVRLILEGICRVESSER
jgi:hypothetical protein